MKESNLQPKGNERNPPRVKTAHSPLNLAARNRPAQGVKADNPFSNGNGKAIHSTPLKYRLLKLAAPVLRRLARFVGRYEYRNVPRWGRLDTRDMVEIHRGRT